MRHMQSLARDKLGLKHTSGTLDEEHLRGAADWLLRAQAATPDDGVAHSYDIRKRKWLASYPETTGYIIPTLYDYASHFGISASADAARRLASLGGCRTASRRWHPGRYNGSETVACRDGLQYGTVIVWLATGCRGNPRRTDQFVACPRGGLASRRAGCRWLLASLPSPFTTTRTAAYNTRSAFGLTRAYAVAPNRLPGCG